MPNSKQNPPTAAVDVPCGACTACCWHEIVPLTEADDPSSYDTQWINGVQVLRHQPNGACIYLGQRGCRIWTRRPAVCKVFDCRRFVRQHLAGQHHGVVKDHAVLLAGLARLSTLQE